MMQKIAIGMFLYVIAWLVFASFDFNGSDTIVAYQLHPTALSTRNLPKMMTLNPTTYRISGQTVVGQTGNFEPRRYTDCAVVDTENWTCTFEDKSGKFGFRDGDYYTEALDGRSITDDWQSVSRFRYVWNHVEWNLASDSWLQKMMIFFIPFAV